MPVRKQRYYDLTKGEFPELGKIPDEMMKTVLKDVGNLVRKRARAEAPDSGEKHRKKLRPSMQKRVYLARGYVRVYSSAPHAWLVHDGTQPHTIRPQKGRHLAFRVGGRLVLARVVHHPGARANPFLERAVEKSEMEIRQIMAAGAREAMDRAI